MTTDLNNVSPGLLKSWEFTLMRTAALLSLTKAQYETIESRYGTLQTILNAANEKALEGAHIFPQGSIMLKTTIRPVANAPGEMGTVDADAIVLIDSTVSIEPAELLETLQRRFEEGARVDAPIEPLRRGVRVTYADENPGFHMDVTPAVGRPNLSNETGYGNLYVPDRETGWKNSSPRSYAEWLERACNEEVNIIREDEMIKAMAMDSLSMESTQDPIPEYHQYLEHNPLRATIKLLKRHRDVWAIRNDEVKVRPISAVITTLAAHSYRRIALLSKQRPYRAIEAILEIVNGMHDHINVNAKGEYEVLNPMDSGENFAEKWNRPREGGAYVQAFSRWHNQVIQDLRIGLRDHGSQANFLDSFHNAFRIQKSEIDGIITELPRTAPLPGRNGLITGASLALSAFTGSSSAASTSQGNIKPVDRLG
ncbi:nucleotidyltransferase [Herbaspirillum huttiense]|uniref:nucleotidyltransferase domain-containing protein n=1 Tax=Herbaspirillum huttiense TaxID=863372 RepID=UPI0031E132F0